MDLGLTDEQFLTISPRALHLMAERLRMRDLKLRINSAWIEAAIYNVNRDTDRRPEPFTAADFVPELSEERADNQMDDMRAFVMELESGEDMAPSKEEVDGFKESMSKRFRFKKAGVEADKPEVIRMPAGKMPRVS